ncbi:MAG: polysaccharide export protein [Rhodocyclaceae bacterium]|nr:polysaccharide export protein [Rhodocyclaceae bacterium]
MLRLLLVFLLFFSLRLAAAEQELVTVPVADPYAYVSLSNYRLAPGDMISVRVLGEEELSREKVRLTDAGTVPLPAVGEIQVLGLKIKDVERVVADSLRGRYLVNPKVSVIIEEYRPFYVNGMVAKPGAYPYQPGMTVRKAASLAGGFTERASLDKVFVIREASGSKAPIKISVDTEVLPGDIVTIEESFF